MWVLGKPRTERSGSAAPRSVPRSPSCTQVNRKTSGGFRDSPCCWLQSDSQTIPRSWLCCLPFGWLWQVASPFSASQPRGEMQEQEVRVSLCPRLGGEGRGPGWLAPSSAFPRGRPGGPGERLSLGAPATTDRSLPSLQCADRQPPMPRPQGPAGTLAPRRLCWRARGESS